MIRARGRRPRSGTSGPSARGCAAQIRRQAGPLAKADSVTRTSPGPAALASRAVTLTSSPSAVNSTCSPVPTAPTKAMPVLTPMPTGSHGLPPPVPGGLQQLECRAHRLAGVECLGERREEDSDDLVADELVHERIVTDQYRRMRSRRSGPGAGGNRPGASTRQAGSSRARRRRGGCTRSPRRLAFGTGRRSSRGSTSGCLTRVPGLIRRITGPPTPPKGRWQSLQRGELGIERQNRRSRFWRSPTLSRAAASRSSASLPAPFSDSVPGRHGSIVAPLASGHPISGTGDGGFGASKAQSRVAIGSNTIAR